MSRERDIRNAVQALLKDTGNFDDVYLWGLPAVYGSSADKLAVAAIDPNSTRIQDLTDDTDGALIGYCQLVVTFLFRHEDPQLRDEGVELLLDAAMNAINGETLVAGLTMPAKTIFRNWKWEQPIAPERRITASLEVGYELDGWDSFDTDE